jgi:hypothetical protein
LLVTGFGDDDWANPEVRAVPEKFLRAYDPRRASAYARRLAHLDT